MLSGRQQVTLLEWLEKVKTLSKKSTEKALLVLPGNHELIDELKGSSTKTLTLLQPHILWQMEWGIEGVTYLYPPYMSGQNLKFWWREAILHQNE